MKVSYCIWANTHAYVGKGIVDGTTEEAMLNFFYDGVSPWMNRCGYTWSQNEDLVSQKFVRFCYEVHCALKGDYDLAVPEAKHRDYDEDRDTFDHFVTMDSFTTLCEEWECRHEIIGTRLEALLLEFCYVWVDVMNGKPGAFTHKILMADEEENEDELITAPEFISKKKYDLY